MRTSTGRRSTLVMLAVMAAALVATWAGAAAGAATVSAAATAPASADDAVAILRNADHARGNVEGVTWKVELESREKEKVNRLTVLVKSRRYDFLGEELEPPKYKGQKLLMVSGNMWFTKPGLSKPIPISRRQRLMGEAAHGDIAATNYADEYDATITGEEVLGGKAGTGMPGPTGEAGTRGEACLVFDLRAKDKKPTYDRIRYWVSKERSVGVKAEYYTVSGKLIKTAVMEYERTAMPGREARPFISRIVITDALVSTNVTTLTFREPRFGEIPDEVFNVNMLGH
jgi:hypothetical protein